jgi:hypothetical protein
MKQAPSPSAAPIARFRDKVDACVGHLLDGTGSLMCGSAAAAEEGSFGVGGGHGGGPPVGGCGLAVAAKPPEQVGSGGVEEVVAVQVQLLHQGQRGSRAVDLADGDGPVEGHDRVGATESSWSYRARIWDQSVSAMVAASAWTALMAAWS